MIAKVDLRDITDYTCRVRGQTQADRYLDHLEDCCERLAKDPLIGRPYDIVQPNHRRLEQGRHVIYYEHQDEGILVYRILHQSMLPSRQVFDESEEYAGPNDKLEN
jgi:toxin ParE1/3/4